MRPLHIKVAAAQATLDRFKDVPFAFGSSDCAKLVAFHLRQLGYRPGMSKAGKYTTAVGARAALKRLGVKSIAEKLDAIGLERIAPAAVVAGDIVQGASGDEFAALGVVLGNGRLVGFHEQAAGAAVLQIIDIAAAWRT